jgi:hypothetical protein
MQITCGLLRKKKNELAFSSNADPKRSQATQVQPKQRRGCPAMSIEVMKQWLEALELMYACYAHPEWISHKQQEEKILAQCVATTMTLRQAIAVYESAPPECQTEAEKKAFAFGWWKAMESQRAEKKEPVAWQVHPFDYGIGHEGVYARTDRLEQVEAWKRKGWNVQPLYTQPQPQREWVGLTDEEIDGLVKNTRWHELIKATEAKLKKNNGF